MAQEHSPGAVQFTAFRSALQEAAIACNRPPQHLVLRALQTRAEAEATYFSRRAQEERQASANAPSRKCREVHLELALAYEFRAHLFTHEMCAAAASELQAL